MFTPASAELANTSVAISGGGLAGLCLAQSLHRAGFNVGVYERDASPHARHQGYRITVDQHGTAALKYCLPTRLFAAVLATASSPGDVGYFRFTNRNLGEIFKLTFKHDRSSDRRVVMGQVDRATLRSIMLAGLEDKVHFGKEATRVELVPGGAALHFADGSAVRASVVVGADGIHSALRRQVLGDCPVRDTGALGIYGKTPLTKDHDSLVPPLLMNSGVLSLGDEPGRGFFFTTMQFNELPGRVFARLVPSQQPPVRADYIMWAILLRRQDCPSNVWELNAEALHRIAVEASRGYHPVLQRFVERADVDYTVVTSLSAATRPQAWPASRVTLMGDAVHVMPPTGAHGGNTALRDAALLGRMLTSAVSGGIRVEEAIATYQNEMTEYSFKEVDASTKMLSRSNVENPLLRFVMLRAIPWLRLAAHVSPRI